MPSSLISVMTVRLLLLTNWRTPVWRDSLVGFLPMPGEFRRRQAEMKGESHVNSAQGGRGERQYDREPWRNAR